jgi:hypothetical protein
MLKKILITIFLTIATVIVPNLQAATAIEYGLIAAGIGDIVSGTTTSIVNGGQVTVAWSVKSLAEYTYNYTITFAASPAPVGNFILETSAMAALSEFTPNNTTVNSGPANYSGTPGSIFGLDFANQAASNVVKISITTLWGPAYGDFLLTAGGITAYNANFGTSPIATTTDFSGWIAAPLVPIPEPSLYLCMGIPLIFTVLYKAKALKFSQA